MADRKLTVCNGRRKDYSSTPNIVLQGKWLKQTGFCVGDKITVECQSDKLIITGGNSSPKKKTEYPPPIIAAHTSSKSEKDLLLFLRPFALLAKKPTGHPAREWPGIGMFELYVIHHILNRKWC